MIFQLDETPVKAEWVHRSEDLVPALAVVFEKSIRIYHGKDCEGPLRVLDKLHFKPVVAIKYNSHFDTAISVDEGGMVEYWHGPQVPSKCTIFILIKKHKYTVPAGFCNLG